MERVTAPGDPPISRWQFQTSFPYFSSHATPSIVRAAISEFGGGKPAVWRPVAAFLRSYQLDGGYTPGPLLVLLTLTGLAGSLVAFSQPDIGELTRQQAGACLLFFACAVSVTLVSDLFVFSWRYQLPALVTLVPAGRARDQHDHQLDQPAQAGTRIAGGRVTMTASQPGSAAHRAASRLPDPVRAAVLFVASLALLLAIVQAFSRQPWSMLDLRVYLWGGALVRHSQDPYLRSYLRLGLHFTYTPMAAALFALATLISLPVVKVLTAAAGVASLVAVHMADLGSSRPPPSPPRSHAGSSCRGAVARAGPADTVLRPGQPGPHARHRGRPGPA